MKTRLQSSDKKVIKSVGGVRRDFVLKNLVQIIQKEGYRAFFKGLPITLGGVVPARTIYFFTYNSAKSAIDSNQPYAHALSVILFSDVQRKLLDDSFLIILILTLKPQSSGLKKKIKIAKANRN